MADNNNDSLIKWARTFVTKDIEKQKSKRGGDINEYLGFI